MYAKESTNIGASQDVVLPQGQPKSEGTHHQTTFLGGVAHLLAEYFEIERSSVSHEQNRSNRNADQSDPEKDKSTRPPIRAEAQKPRTDE